MRPRERRETSEQDLFRSRLDQIIEMKHAHAQVEIVEHDTPTGRLRVTANHSSWRRPWPSREFIASLGGAAAVVCSRTRAAALPTDRPICNARVPQAIGQSFDWLIPAEAEVLGARVADRPAAFPLAELEQRASASVVDRDVFSADALSAKSLESWGAQALRHAFAPAACRSHPWAVIGPGGSSCR